MDRRAFDVAAELVKAIEFTLLSAPVELLSPVGDQFLEICEIGAIPPAAFVCFRQAGARQALPQIGKDGVCNFNLVGVKDHILRFYEVTCCQHAVSIENALLAKST